MVEAAGAYVRIKIRVPEAYLMLRDYEATRPGLLVMDADGRRVSSLAIGRLDPTDLAGWLAGQKKAKGQERYVVAMKGGDQKKLRAEVRGRVARDGSMVVKTELSIDEFRAIAERHEVELSWRDPVAIRISGAGDLSRVAGIRHVAKRTAYMTRLLLHPRALVGFKLDIEARTYELPGVPTSARGAGVAMAPRRVAGVLTVFPDLFNESETVVARKGKIQWPQVAKAFESAGVPPK